MKVRRPTLDFAATPARWAAIPEFAHSMNAPSLWIPYLERFLNRVLAKAAKSLENSSPDIDRIKADVRIFIRQESTHLAAHEAFNSILRREGYDVAAFERLFEEEFDRLFRTKSLIFLCAYCEGFETMGPPAALAWLDNMEDLLEGADPQVVKLWKWHLMEEYEHRTVCHDIFHAVGGTYFQRMHGLIYQFFHPNGFSAKVRNYLLETDRASMSPAERKQSIRRQRKVTLRLAFAMLPRLAGALSPFYTPRNAAEPRMFKSYMATVEAGLR